MSSCPWKKLQSLHTACIPHQNLRIVLFVKLNNSIKLSEGLKNQIKSDIKINCSPKHVPAFIYQTPDIPYTMNGKKIELAVKNIIEGRTISNKDSISNPSSLSFFESFKVDS